MDEKDRNADGLPLEIIQPDLVPDLVFAQISLTVQALQTGPLAVTLQLSLYLARHAGPTHSALMITRRHRLRPRELNAETRYVSNSAPTLRDQTPEIRTLPAQRLSTNQALFLFLHRALAHTLWLIPRTKIHLLDFLLPSSTFRLGHASRFWC